MSTKEKPSLDEVLKYGRPMLRKFIAKYARDLEPEHKEEIEQEGFVRLIEHYPRMNPAEGIRSFVYLHCRGTVLDYLKAGDGVEESRWTIAKNEDGSSRFKSKIRERVSVVNDNDESVGVDSVLGMNGIFESLKIDDLEIRWELVARLASRDDQLHAFARHLREQTIEEMAPNFGLKRARVGQMIQAFIERFDDPRIAAAHDAYFRQVCFAFGICKLLGLPDQDLGIGWDYAEVDLDKPFEDPQLSMMESLGG